MNKTNKEELASRYNNKERALIESDFSNMIMLSYISMNNLSIITDIHKSVIQVVGKLYNSYMVNKKEINIYLNENGILNEKDLKKNNLENVCKVKVFLNEKGIEKFETDLPHEIFNIKENGEIVSKGLVFNSNDLEILNLKRKLKNF